MTASTPDFDSLFRLDGQVAVVTGGGGAIGGLAAGALAQAGAHVIVTDHDEAAATAVAAGIETADARQLDVTDDAAVDNLMADIDAARGRIDVLVNAAGISKRLASEEIPLDTWNQVLAVNLTGSFLCARAAARVMLRRRAGAIINISSIMGHSGGGLYPNPAYHASKGGIVNLTRALAAEWGDRGIRVNDIAPTFVDTPLATPVLGDPAMRAEIERLHPLGRVARVDDLAGAILYLASPASALVTGQSLAVDGGWLAR